MSRLGDILSELREDRGLTQLEVSEILHISNSSVSAYETGARVPNIDILVALSALYNVTTDYLLGLSECNTSPSVLNEEFIDGISLGTIIQSLSLLAPKQRIAVSQVINDMRFCAEVSVSANRME